MIPPVLVVRYQGTGQRQTSDKKIPEEAPGPLVAAIGGAEYK